MGESFNSAHLTAITEIINLIKEHPVFEEIDAAPSLDYDNGGREALFELKHFHNALKANKGQYKCAGTLLANVSKPKKCGRSRSFESRVPCSSSGITQAI